MIFKKKLNCFTLACVLFSQVYVSLAKETSPLLVSENGRHLVYADGTPFFYMADTAWELLHRLSLVEAEYYFRNRSEKGFTVVQTVGLAELDGLHTPNANGDLPLIDDDPLQPNEAYWAHVDAVFDIAEKHGIVLALLPTWGDKVELESWGTGPVVFDETNAFSFAQWIGKRYGHRSHLIWVVGGDRSCGLEQKPVWEAFGRGLKSVDQRHLITYHPRGGQSSSMFFHNADWLDFNMMQTGHWERFAPNFADVAADYALQPAKPCMDGEPSYEEHPINWDRKNGWFNDFDLRRMGYGSVFAGACGFTYGAHPVWQMYDEGREPVGHVRMTWKEALDAPGAEDMGHLRNLIESRDMLSRVPDQGIIRSGYGGLSNPVLGCRGKDYMMVYLSAGYSVIVKTLKLQCEKLKAWWYSPRDGQSIFIGEMDAGGETEFRVPIRGIDWVLVLDNAEAGYAEPGYVQR